MTVVDSNAALLSLSRFGLESRKESVRVEAMNRWASREESCPPASRLRRLADRKNFLEVQKFEAIQLQLIVHVAQKLSQSSSQAKQVLSPFGLRNE
ncbi:hypothetical protein CFBP4996_28575 (plasmid) [Agrobacterium leguminum]|uniref:Uncharacterized protein n=1 Tax=Agrobacterium deltaense NCPPB 1641 TaxID=1183425 RepID=A0A1S7UBZ6_9HYPH|nr:MULTISPECIES: hypothetical protein [Agrobacterium]WFS69694.1 hypothetical protein CFBP4996_28575 [Agrobacterium leguminum]CVI63908.1 hypothetical protein AGR7A_pAt30027 [Agrobacterium deltaense NCPPB 1641]